MRHILMSKPGEFLVRDKSSYTRGLAIKMLANLLKKPSNSAKGEEEVVVTTQLIVKKASSSEE